MLWKSWSYSLFCQCFKSHGMKATEGCLILRLRCPPIIIGMQVYSSSFSLAENSETVITASVHTILAQSPFYPMSTTIMLTWDSAQVRRSRAWGWIRITRGFPGPTPQQFDLGDTHQVFRNLNVQWADQLTVKQEVQDHIYTLAEVKATTIFQCLRGSHLFQQSKDGVFYFFLTKYSRLDVVSRPLKYLNVLLRPTA